MVDVLATEVQAEVVLVADMLATEVQVEVVLVAVVMAMVAVATVMEEIEGLRLAVLEEVGKRVGGASMEGVAAMAPEAAGRLVANMA